MIVYYVFIIVYLMQTMLAYGGGGVKYTAVAEPLVGLF